MVDPSPMSNEEPDPDPAVLVYRTRSAKTVVDGGVSVDVRSDGSLLVLDVHGRGIAAFSPRQWGTVGYPPVETAKKK